MLRISRGPLHCRSTRSLVINNLLGIRYGIEVALDYGSWVCGDCDVAAAKTRRACSGGQGLVRLFSVRLGKGLYTHGVRASRAASKRLKNQLFGQGNFLLQCP